MLFWIVAAVMTAAVVVLLVPPLLRRPGAGEAARAAYDLEVYRDQLAELERDEARGVINAAQAAAAKAEIGRRMLAVSEEAPQPPSPAATRSARILAGLLVIAVPLGAVTVYGRLGSPGTPAEPLASRNLDQERAGPPKRVLAAMETLKAELAKNPDDAQGWSILGQAYAKMGRFDEAIDALRKAATLAKDDLEIQGTYAEALTSANSGTVPEEARKRFETILAKDPRDTRARFYVALSRHQAGDLKGALERFQALMKDSPADAPWIPVVSGEIATIAKALNLDPAKETPRPLPAEQPPAQQPSAQQPPMAGADPGAAGPEAAGPMAGAGGDREQMIRGMVAGLAAKLEANPSDIDGWLKLVRSYSVLGEPDKALDAARKAKAQAPDRPDVLVAYATALLSSEPKTDKPGPMPAEVVATLRQALKGDPVNRDALWLLGLDAAGAGRKAEASDLWMRLLGQFKPSDPEYSMIRTRIDGLKAGG